MGSLAGFLFVYVLGGLTFIPLLLGLLFLYTYLTAPPSSKEASQEPGQHQDGLSRSSDDAYSLKSGTDVLAEKFQRTHEGDVASGYFAVCREYVPGGVNGRPPERTTPAGEVITAESPSVYQAMYRSIFDRKQSPTIEPSKGNGKNARKSRNVFYVVLRHGHLMLYDDADQIEVRYVISLAHHNVSICGVGDPIPEGELWIKRNAICLTRKPSIPESQAPQNTTLPFYLFSENLSEKEDFYFAILNNLEKVPGSPDTPPTPEHFHVNHMITLVRRLHSSEEHLQTRWINALIGRLFLALYKTEQLEDLLWKKLSKKISRVKKPNFITQVALQKVDAGEGAPFITNPRLKDLTIDGDCCVEADVDYSGNFRIQVAATARIDLGARFKAREVDLVLAVVLKKLKGRVLLRFKPSPSNRLWLSFETMPAMEMAIEPIVSSRQITYGIIIRAIESRIREVVAETLVQPFWDDVPFFDTDGQRFRGGIWHREPQLDRNTVIPDETGGSQDSSAQASSIFLAEQMDTVDETTPTPSSNESDPSEAGLQNGSKTPSSDTTSLSSAVDKATRPDPTRTIRARTFSQVADPVLTAEPINANHTSLDAKSQDKNATSEMIKISGRSQPNSPTASPVAAPIRQPETPTHSLHQSSSNQELNENLTKSRPRTQSSSAKMSSNLPNPGSEKSYSMPHLNSDAAQQEIIADSKKGGPKPSDPRHAANALGSAAAAAAKKWGLNVFNRSEPSSRTTERTATFDQPMGRGRPLPPPGTPLPPPDRSSFSTKSMPLPKRKPVPPPFLPERPQVGESARPVPKPPLPKRPSVSNNMGETPTNDDLMIIEAPPDPEPNSPFKSDTPDSWNTKDDSASVNSQYTDSSTDLEKKLA